jgi:hypothetical protein
LLVNNITLSQFYYFGRNKVQYDKFDWKVLRTEHFNIYYYGEMEEMAEIGAYTAEEAYNEFKVTYNNIVTVRIPLIFYNTLNHFQETNTTPGFIPEGVGGFFEFLKGRVVIPSTGSLHDFRHVIRHELTHVFMTNKIYRVLTDHRLSTDFSPPLWFTEGLAEFMSTEPDEQSEMVMRDAVINGYFVDLDNIYQIYGTFIMYKEGQNFLEFVKEKYGSEKVPLMVENIWMYQNFNKVIEYTIGKSIKEIDKDWVYYLKQKYYPLFAFKKPIEVGAQKLTMEGFNFAPVHFKNEKGDYLYFVADRDGYSSLYRLNLNDKSEDPNVEIVIRGEKTEQFEAFHLFQSSIDISKDGILSFVTKSGSTDEIHFYSTKENRVIKEYRNSNLININSPKFSDDGEKIVFNAIDQKGFSDIMMLNWQDEELTRLTNDYYDDKDPVFGIDNNQIIFSSDRTSGKYAKIYNLYSYNLNSHIINNITYLGSNCTAPQLSPTKNILIFTSEADGVRNISSIDIKNNIFSDSVKKVTNFITSIYNPAFINKDTITFSGFENLGFNLYRMNFSLNPIDSNLITKMKIDTSMVLWKPGMFVKESEREKANYRKEYTLDYAQSEISTDPVFGTQGGAVLSLSDLFNDDNYFFLIYNTAQVQSDFLKSFNVALEKVYLGERANYGFGIFNFSGQRFDLQDPDQEYYERSFGGYFLLNFPLTKFQRIETEVSIANSDKEVFTGIIERKALLLSNSLSWVFDNSIWSSTGPIDGIRAKLLLGYTGDIKYSNVDYFAFIADYRQYFRLGSRTALAFRSALMFNEGKEARRYFMGGSWDLRGWPRWSILGEKLWISSLEFRFPLIDQFRIQFPFIDLGFFGIRGAAFFDAGNAWDNLYGGTLGSIGAGLRFNLFGALVFRYDIGKTIQNNFNNFQPGLFYQFFFGWDF